MREWKGEPVWMSFEPNLTNAKFKRWGSEDKTRKTRAQIFLKAVKVKGSDGIIIFSFIWCPYRNLGKEKEKKFKKRIGIVFF